MSCPRAIFSAVVIPLFVVSGVGAEQDHAGDVMSRRIDELLRHKWQSDGIHAAPLASDSEFMRRAYLDLTGVIPPVSEVREFLDDNGSDKRRQLIDRLLQSPRYPTHMANTWRDIILPPDFEPNRLASAVGLQRWLRRQFAANLRYDRIVAEFVSASGNEQNGPALFYRALEAKPEKLAASTSRIFLGLQIQCAECHDHPFDSWTQKEFWGYAAFFAQLQPPQMNPGQEFRLVDRREGDVTLPDSDEVVPPKYPGGAQADPDALGTRRRQLSIWIASRDNPFLATAAVNRVWAHMFGRGLIDPVDDIGEHNPAAHPQLVQELSDYFVDTGFDLRNLFKTIANTQVYQLSSQTGDGATSTPVLFERMAVKTLTAEQLYDSLLRTLTRPYGSSSGPMGDSQKQQFVARMQTLARDPTDYRMGLQQVLHMLNGAEVHAATGVVDAGILAALDAPFFDDQQRIETLLLATLSRYPSETELNEFSGYVRLASEDKQRKEALGDILWALLNSAEFQLNH